MQKEKTQFVVNGLQVNGYFHLPEGEKTALPIIVMFNGYGTEWSFGTQPFIEAFTQLGFATLNVDYRYFGQSEGEPRQLLDIPAQLEDCRAAIEHVLLQEWVDKNRIVIWGSSLGGGHAISMAAEFAQVKALIAQVPHCCSRAAMKTVTLGAIFKGMSTAVSDKVASLFNKPVKTIPIVAIPEEYGVMNHKGWKQHYLSLAQHSKTWVNAIPARSLLKGGDYRPVLQAQHIQCSTLLVAATNDSGVPVQSIRDTAQKIAQSEIYEFAGEHFDVYHGHYFADVLNKELAFLRESVLFS
jgi:dipeptidyl aminopeptidase/acylaminoacyl peptidase